MTRALLIALLPGCFSLSDLAPYPCGADATCPEGFACEQQLDASYQCIGTEEAGQDLPANSGPVCNGRYQIQQFGSGLICGECPGSACDGSGRVKDLQTSRVWTRKYTELLNYTTAQWHCEEQGMRLPTRAEALGIAGAQYSACAFPCGWGTWTSDIPVPDPSTPESDYVTYFVQGNGDSKPIIAYCYDCDDEWIATVMCVR